MRSLLHIHSLVSLCLSLLPSRDGAEERRALQHGSDTHLHGHVLPHAGSGRETHCNRQERAEHLHFKVNSLPESCKAAVYIGRAEESPRLELLTRLITRGHLSLLLLCDYSNRSDHIPLILSEIALAKVWQRTACKPEASCPHQSLPFC